MADRRSRFEKRRQEEQMIMTFEDLESWQQARQLTHGIYTLTRNDTLAKDFGLYGQIQRSSVSIMSRRF
jgi:hypothetical protein